MVVQRMYRYRIYPSGKQKIRLINSLKTCKTIYNELLALSIDSWKYGQVSLNKFDYCAITKGYSSNVNSQVIQNVSDRVHKAFQNFFRRVKDKSYKKKGFPRFKSRVNSITFPQSKVKIRDKLYHNGYKLLSNKRLFASKMGNIPIVLHRIPKGKIKTLTIKVNHAGQWFAVFCCEIDTPKIIHPSKAKVGIDVGLENFATLSNGESIGNPRYLVTAEKRLKLLNRRLSRKMKGSNNRRKARFRLAVQHIKVANQRTDFLHKLSFKLVKAYSLIAVEDLNIINMLQTHRLAKHITDASWNTFINMLSYKEVTLGGQCMKVNPSMTSKTCSKCGHIQDMPLSEREFVCGNCGFVVHRDLNSANNILVRADCPELNACGDSTSVTEQSVASQIVEAGTINDIV